MNSYDSSDAVNHWLEKATNGPLSEYAFSRPFTKDWLPFVSRRVPSGWMAWKRVKSRVKLLTIPGENGVKKRIRWLVANHCKQWKLTVNAGKARDFALGTDLERFVRSVVERAGVTNLIKRGISWTEKEAFARRINSSLSCACLLRKKLKILFSDRPGLIREIQRENPFLRKLLNRRHGFLLKRRKYRGSSFGSLTSWLVSSWKWRRSKSSPRASSNRAWAPTSTWPGYF